MEDSIKRRAFQKVAPNLSLLKRILGLAATSSYDDGGSANNGAFFPDTFGSHIVATERLDEDTVVVECPFDLLITKSLAKDAVLDILQNGSANDYQHWTERQWICTYLSLHWILGPNTQK